MRTLRVAKVIFYPIAGIMQFWLYSTEMGHEPYMHPNPILPAIGVALIALAVLNLKRLLDERKP